MAKHRQHCCLIGVGIALLAAWHHERPAGAAWVPSGHPQSPGASRRGELLLRQAAGEKGNSVRNAVGGAVLGGLFLGPVGAVFGAALGSRVGRDEAADRAAVERMGLDEEMVSLAQTVARELADAVDSRNRVSGAKDDLAARTVKLEEEVEYLGLKAMAALEAGDEVEARRLLEGKIASQEKLDSLKAELSKALQRLSALDDSVQRLERRALQIQSLLQRAQAASGSERMALKNEASRLSLSEANDPFAAFDQKLGGR